MILPSGKAIKEFFKGPDGVSLSFTPEQYGRQTVADTIMKMKMDVESPEMNELKELVKKDLGLSDVKSVTPQDILSWALKSKTNLTQGRSYPNTEPLPA